MPGKAGCSPWRLAANGEIPAFAGMTEKGLAVVADAERGLDHGAWVPLSLIYPDADVPVVQLSIASHASPEWHYALGQALVPLRDEGVLIVGSGSITPNLRALFSARLPIDAPAPAWVSDFTGCDAERMAAGAVEDVMHRVERAQHGSEEHTSE